MPRFLNTSTGEFVWIVDPSKERYAILSHTWDDIEQTYDYIRNLQATVEELVKDTRSSLLSFSTDLPSITIFDQPNLFVKVKGI